MTSSCLRPAELPDAAHWTPDDPRRHHLDACPACRALVHAYDEFMAADSGAWSDEQAAAETILARRLARQMGAGGIARIRRGRPYGWRARSWLAAAAVLAICGGFFLARDLSRLIDARPPSGSGELRGDGGPEEVRWQEVDGAWRLVWDAEQPGRPEVVFLAANLGELARLVPGPDEPLVLTPEEVPVEAVFLQLVFLADTDTLGRSVLVTARPAGR